MERRRGSQRLRLDNNSSLSDGKRKRWWTDIVWISRLNTGAEARRISCKYVIEDLENSQYRELGHDASPTPWWVNDSGPCAQYRPPFLVSTTRSFLGPNVHAGVHDYLPLTPKSSPSQKRHNDRRSGSSYTNQLLTLKESQGASHSSEDGWSILYVQVTSLFSTPRYSALIAFTAYYVGRWVILGLEALQESSWIHHQGVATTDACSCLVVQSKYVTEG